VRVRVSGQSDGDGPKEHTGVVARLAPSLDAQSRSLMIEADIKNPGTLRPGNFVQARIVVGQRSVITVPEAAVVTFAGLQKVILVEGGKAVERQLGADERARLRVLLISMDPARDTPAALRRTADQRRVDTTRWTLAQPRPEDVRSVAGLLGIRYRLLADGEFNHTSALVLLDAEGRVLARTERMGSKPDPEFVDAVKRALAGG
jgi:multidrug efflux pump subunit AcrA (membrane-fusion protein)